jgi:hypothetical protein
MIYETLNDLPGDIEEAYQKALIKISKNPRKVPKIRSLLAWIFVAKRKLTLEELGSVLRIEFPEKLLGDCPTCLIRITEEEREGTLFPYPGRYRTVEFDHSSVREFFGSARLQNAGDKTVSQYFIDISESNLNAAIQCLDIILAQNHPESLELAVKNEPILSYAATYWFSHASFKPSIPAKGSGFLGHPKIVDRVHKLFSDSHACSLLNWLRVYDPDQPDRHPDLLRPWEECAEPLHYAALLGLEGVVESLLKRGAQIRSTKGSFDDAFVAAALHGQVSCLEKMLETGYAPSLWSVYHIVRGVRDNAVGVMNFILNDNWANGTAGHWQEGLTNDRILDAAVKNRWNAAPLIDILIMHGLPLKITADIAMAAANNRESGEDAMLLLLRKQQNDLPITEETLAVIARYFSGEIMELALDRMADTTLTARVGLAAVGNLFFKVEVFSVLLDRIGSQFKITEAMVNEAASGWWVNRQLLGILIRRGGREMPMTTKLVQAVARLCDGELMDLLLTRGNHVPITENIVVAAAENHDHAVEMMRVLLDWGNEAFQVTSAVIEAASSNSGCRLDLMKFLVNEPGTNELVITRETIKQLTKDMEVGAEVMKIFFEHGSRVVFSDDAVELVMMRFDTDVVEPLLDHHEVYSITVSEEAIRAAVIWNHQHGKEIVSLLLTRLGQDFPASDEIVTAVAEELDMEVMELLLELKGTTVSATTELISSVAKNQYSGTKLFEVLVRYTGAEIEVNDDVIQASASNPSCGKAMTICLLSHNDAKFDLTEVAVVAVASALDGDTVSLVLDRWAGSRELPEAVLKAAVQNGQYGADVVKVLLGRYGDDIPLTLDVVNHAAGNEICGCDIMALLLDWDHGLPLTEATMKIVAGNAAAASKILDLLLERRPNSFPVTATFLKAVLCHEEQGLDMMKALLSKRRNDVFITPEILACAARNYKIGPETVRLLLTQSDTDSLLTEEVLTAAVSNWWRAEEVLDVLFNGHQWDYIPLTAMVMASVDSPFKLIALLRLLPRDLAITESKLTAVIKNDDSDARMTSLLLDYYGQNILITNRVIQTDLERYGFHGGVIDLILRRRSEDFPVTEEIIRAMARRCSRDLILLLLDQRGAEVSITNSLLKAAAENQDHGPEVLKLLLDLQQVIPVTEELVIAAAKNDRRAPELMSVLLDRYGNGVPVTAKILATITGVCSKGEETMTLLVQKRGQDITLTEEVVRTASRSRRWGHKVFLTLLRGLGLQSRITEEATAAMASDFGPDELAILLDRCGKQVPITETVILAAGLNLEHGEDVVKMLLHRRPGFVISEEVIIAVLTLFPAEVLALLLDQHGSDITITEEIVMAAAEEAEDDVMQFLLDWPFQEIPASARVTEAIAGRFDGKMMSLLLARQGDKVKITEQIVSAAIRQNIDYGKEVLLVLLDQRAEELQISEAMLADIAGRFDGETMSLLLASQGEKVRITEQIASAAIRRNTDYGSEVLSVLLDQRAEELQINEAMLADITGRLDTNIIKRVYTHLGTDFTLTSAVIRAAAPNQIRSGEIIEALVSQDTSISPQVMVELTKHFGSEMMRIMLQHQREDVHITKEVMIAITENYQYGEELMLLLLEERASQIPLTDSTLIKIVGRFDATVISTLLDKRGADVVLTEEVIIAALDSKEYLGVMEILLDRRVEDIPLTEPIVMAIIGRLNATAVTLLLDKRAGDLEITEALLSAALNNHRHGGEVLTVLLIKRAEDMPISEAIVTEIAEKFGEDIIELLLEKRGNDVAITEELIMAITRKHRADELMTVLITQGQNFPGNDNALAAIAKSFGRKVLDLFLDKHAGSTSFTEKVLVAAASNSDHGAEVVERLLGISQIPITPNVVNTAACNYSSGAYILAVLLDQGKMDIPIKPNVIQAAVEGRDGELLNVLIKRRKHEIPITAALVETCTECSIKTLLLQREHYSLVTAQAIAAIAERYGPEIMGALLHVHGPDVPITEDVITAAAMNEGHGPQLVSLLLGRVRVNLPVTERSLNIIIRKSQNAAEILELLFQWKKDIMLTEELVRLAAANRREGRKLISLFFHRMRNQLPMTESIVRTAAKNSTEGLEIMDFLIEKWGDSLPITEGAIMAALRNLLHWREMINLLQVRYHIPVTARTLEVAASDVLHATEMLTMLLARDGSGILITEAVLSAAIQNWSQVETLLPILIVDDDKKCRVIVTERMMEEATLTSYRATAALLPFLPDEVPISAKAMHGIVTHDKNDAPLTKHVLNKRGGNIPITAAMVKVGTEYYNRKEIIKLLFEHHGDRLQVTEDLVIETARAFDGELVTLLLDRQDTSALVTEAVVQAALENTDACADILKALVKLQIEIPVTERILQDVAQNPKSSEEVMGILLSNRPSEISTTEKIMKAAVSNENLGEAMLKLFLSHSSGTVPVTEDVVATAVMNNGCGKELFDLLLDQGFIEGVPITQNIIMAAAGNTTNGSNMIARILEQNGKEYLRPFVTAELLIAAMSNSYEGLELVKLLLSLEMDIPITTETLKAAVTHSYHAAELVELLLGHPCFNTAITTEVLQIAVGNGYDGARIIKLLLNRDSIHTPITDEVMEAAARNSSTTGEIMALLLAQEGASGLITTELLKEAAKNCSHGKEVLDVLFEHRCKDMITEEVVEAACRSSSLETLILVLQEMSDHVQISKNAMKAAVESDNAMDKLRILLQWRDNAVPISEAIVTKALSHFDAPKMLRFLLHQWGKDVPITEEVVKSVAANWSYGEKLLPLLFDHRGQDVPVTEEVIIAAAGNGSRAHNLIAILLDERGNDLPITENVLKAVVRNEENGLEVLRLLFSEQGGNIPRSEEVLKVAAELPRHAISFFLENHWQVHDGSP